MYVSQRRLILRSLLTPPQRLRNWYSYHVPKIEGQGKKPSQPSVSLPLSAIPKSRKPTRIAPWQAYSVLYFKKATPLHSEIHRDYTDFKAGNEDVRSKYSHIFVDHDEDSLATINWLTFYQKVIKDRAKNASEAELAAMSELIEDRYEKAVEAYDRPWNAYPGSENDSEASRKRKYLAR